jgi:membrane associated rhomboid family serine protease
MNIIILIITAAISYFALNNPNLLEKLMFRPFNIKHNNEYWRWITGGFVHADLSHLIVNMLTFYFFSPYVLGVFTALMNDVVLGQVLFVLFYLSAIVMSGIYSYYKNKDNFSYSALGASGAIAALIFVYVILDPFGMIALYFVIKVPTWLFGILYLVYEYVMSKKQYDNIGHDAHFFGAVYGILFIAILYPESIMNLFIQVQNLF